MDLQLIFGKKRFDFEGIPCSTSIYELKKLVQTKYETKLIPNAQKLILKGKIRKDEEKLESLLTKAEKDKKVKLKGKLLLEKGFDHILLEMVAKENDKEEQDKNNTQEEKVQVKQEQDETPLEVPKVGILLRIHQGNEKYQLIVPSLDWKIENVKQWVQSKLGVPIQQQKILIKGKLRENDSSLKECGVNDSSVVKAMLLFNDGYHKATDGESFLKIAIEELENTKLDYEKFNSQISHRLVDSMDLFIQIDICIDRLENILHGLDRPVRMSSMELKKETIESSKILIEKFRDMKKYKLHGER